MNSVELQLEHAFSNNLLLHSLTKVTGTDLGGGGRGGATPPPPPPLREMTCRFLIQLVFWKKKTMWFIGVEEEQETSALHPKKNPGSAPEL